MALEPVNFSYIELLKMSANHFPVIGHRGKGMNLLTSVDTRFKNVKENSILSFNEASRFPISFVEFDVQVPKFKLLLNIELNFFLTSSID